MFLKTVKFEFNGEETVLYELSALQRIEYIGYLATVSKEIPVDGDEVLRTQMASIVGVKVASRLVAMSRWQANITGPSVDELQQQVMSTWPLPAISQAEFVVLEMSLMLPPAKDAADEDEPVSEESGTPEKSTPVS
ncbi:phage minor tail protein G [Kosakonia sacchari]|nr:phage minor tail protein G [Kosakonia sacchari]